MLVDVLGEHPPAPPDLGGHTIKIAVLLLNAGRGSGEIARQHARLLQARNHELVFIHPGVGAGVEGATNIDVALPGPVTPVHEYLPSAGMKQKAVSAMEYEEAMSFVPAYEAALESHLSGVDIVIAHHANLAALAAANVCRRASIPYVLFLHGTGIEPRHEGAYDDKLWARIRDTIERSPGILVTTEYVRDSLVRPMADVQLERFLILPCGIDLREFYPKRTGSALERFDLDHRYVICPGALTKAKGPQNVVAASELYGDVAPTIFLGAGELQASLEDALGERGRFLGFVSAEDKAVLISNATLLVAAPEKKEHFGIIYAEALAGGTPVVAYSGGGVDSIVTSEVGVLTERDPAALGRAARALLLDDDKRLSMSAAGRKRAESTYGSEELASQLERWLLGFCR